MRDTKSRLLPVRNSAKPMAQGTSSSKAWRGPGLVAAAGLLFGAAGLAGCGGPSQPVATPSGDTADYPSGPYPSVDMSSVTACDWLVGQNPQATPVPSGWIDLQAGYWSFSMSINFPVGTTVKIQGQYPNARLFSFDVGEGIGAVVDYREDYRIAPYTGSQSPYTGPTSYNPSIAPGGTYTAYLVFGPKPAQSAKNTLYVDTSTFPSTTKSVITILRIYNAPPTMPIADSGGYPLPTLTVETAQGEIPIASFSPGTASCQNTSNQENAISTAATEALNLLYSTPQAPNPIPPLPLPTQPSFYIYRPASNDLSANLTINADIQYGFWEIHQTSGDLVYIRGQAPTYVTQNGVGAQTYSTDSDANVRHWALCTNGIGPILDGLSASLTTAIELANSQTFACVEDYTATIDSDGYFNILISIPGKQPAAALLAQGYDWLTYGNTNIGVPIYRQVVPSADYSQAMANVSDNIVLLPQLISQVMGNYMPQSTYCGSSVFANHVQAGESHAQVFAACQAGQ